MWRKGGHREKLQWLVASQPSDGTAGGARMYDSLFRIHQWDTVPSVLDVNFPGIRERIWRHGVNELMLKLQYGVKHSLAYDSTHRHRPVCILRGIVFSQMTDQDAGLTGVYAYTYGERSGGLQTPSTKLAVRTHSTVAHHNTRIPGPCLSLQPSLL